jgi:hypothetical protein
MSARGRRGGCPSTGARRGGEDARGSLSLPPAMSCCYLSARPFFSGGGRTEDGRGQSSGLGRRLVAAFTSEAVSRPHRVGLVPPPAALPVLLDFRRSPQTLGSVRTRIRASRFARPPRASTVSSCCRRQQHASRARCHAPGHMFAAAGVQFFRAAIFERPIYSEPVLS